jgi:hypothetical protein
MHRLARLSYLFIATCLLVSGASFSRSQQPSAIDHEHTKWIDGVMREIQTVKPGMSRSALAKVFTEEGGISTRTRRIYVYGHCPYIKVDVEFAPSDEALVPEKPEDKIVSISRPYLQYTISD